jgi:hypothetical protein
MQVFFWDSIIFAVKATASISGSPNGTQIFNKLQIQNLKQKISKFPIENFQLKRKGLKWKIGGVTRLLVKNNFAERHSEC